MHEWNATLNFGGLKSFSKGVSYMPKRWAFKDGEERNSLANSTSLELTVSANAGADAASMEAAHSAEAAHERHKGRQYCTPDRGAIA